MTHGFIFSLGLWAMFEITWQAQNRGYEGEMKEVTTNGKVV